MKGLESYYKLAAIFQAENWDHMSYSLNSLKGVIKGLYRGVLQGISKGHTRSLDYSSHAWDVFGGQMWLSDYTCPGLELLSGLASETYVVLGWRKFSVCESFGMRESRKLSQQWYRETFDPGCITALLQRENQDQKNRCQPREFPAQKKIGGFP